jgi:hypothetical protein
MQRDEHQRQQRDEHRHSELLPDRVRHAHRDQQGEHAHDGVDALTLEVPEGVAVVSLRRRDRSGRQHHHEAEHREHGRRHEQQ